MALGDDWGDSNHRGVYLGHLAIRVALQTKAHKERENLRVEDVHHWANRCIEQLQNLRLIMPLVLEHISEKCVRFSDKNMFKNKG
ncbi:MAG: hypothetical protein OIF56_10465 [Cohaesibacter sp.]|nr:hypothetical protein [Cohaesibacter sp.]MCV6600914.1 hypothetical protein [Cohaesibacter sp.]